MAVKIPDNIEFAGDYDLKNIFLHNHLGEVTDIKNLVQELNIYESIYKNALTGSVVIIDAQNLIAKLEIQGLERISFTLSTPGANNTRDIVDASETTGHPFHVYKITDRKQLAPGTLLYTLHFGSREFMRNLRTKVSQAYEGRLDRSVYNIFLDENYLDSRKTLTFEPCGNSDKIVIPNLRPFDAINMIANKALPEKSNGVGYYFYETTKGFHFRSWENMVVSEGQFDRPIKQEFYYMPLNINDPNIDNKIEHEYKSVESYRFINNFHDVAANTALGTYGHRVITHNMFDKTHNESDYNYHTQFSASVHADHENNYTDQSKHAVVDSVVDYDNETNVSDYPESRVSLQSSTKFLHNDDVGRYGIDAFNDSSTTGQRVSQKNQVVHGTLLKLVVKGQSYLEAGDVIEFDIRPQDTHKELVDVKDHRFAGKYIVVKIRHQIANSEYKMVLECAKDSSYSALASGTVKWKTKNSGALFSTYKDDQGSM